MERRLEKKREWGFLDGTMGTRACFEDGCTFDCYWIVGPTSLFVFQEKKCTTPVLEFKSSLLAD